MNPEGVKCYGLQGTDIYIDDGPLKCTVTGKDQITKTHLFENIVGSPGEIEILFDDFLNPENNV